jgi:hypothetical protein
MFAKVLAASVAAVIWILLLALTLTIAPDDQGGIILLGFLIIGAGGGALLFKRPKAIGSKRDPLARQDPVMLKGMVPPEMPALIDGREPAAARLSLIERLGLTRAARERRAAAQCNFEMENAWSSLVEEAGFARSRIAVAKRSCDRYLGDAMAAPLNPDAAIYRLVLEKRVPEMIRRRILLCEPASPAERRRLLEDLVDQLEQIAAESERRTTRLETPNFDELEIERAYLRAHIS